MGTIHTIVGSAVEDANNQARRLSISDPKLVYLAIVTRDTGIERLFLAWASVEQRLADNETECGKWVGGHRVDKTEGRKGK